MESTVLNKSVESLGKVINVSFTERYKAAKGWEYCTFLPDSDYTIELLAVDEDNYAICVMYYAEEVFLIRGEVTDYGN